MEVGQNGHKHQNPGHMREHRHSLPHSEVSAREHTAAVPFRGGRSKQYGTPDKKNPPGGGLFEGPEISY
jgi:hypothetical protein